MYFKTTGVYERLRNRNDSDFRRSTPLAEAKIAIFNEFPHEKEEHRNEYPSVS